MSIIIRLQNLPWDASALNIRQFFFGLSIPDGGVHIIGGEKGDAFIAFSTDEDARQAMKNDGGYIGSAPVKLFLSSKTEMQNVIAAAREVSAPAPSGVQSISSAAGAVDVNQSQRMRFINPNHNSSQPSSYGQPAYGSAAVGASGARMSFLQQSQQQPMQQTPSIHNNSQQFGRSSANDYRPHGMDFGPRVVTPNEFRQLAPNSSLSRFPNFEHGEVQESRPSRMSFDPRQAFHEQKPQQYWGGNQLDHQNGQLYEPFGAEKQGLSYKKQEPNDGQPLLPPDAYGRREDWSNGVRSPARDFGMGQRQVDEYRLDGSVPRGGFDYGSRNSFERRDAEDDYRRSRVPDNRFDVMGDRRAENPPVGYGSGRPEPYREDERWRNGIPKFGVNRYSPKREFADFYLDRARPAFHDFKGFCVYVRDLPPFFGPRDIRALFAGCDLPSSRLNVVHDKSGKKVGQAYMKLSCPEELDTALRENGRVIDGHKVRVTRCHEKDFEEAGLPEARPRSRQRSRSPRRPVEQEGYYLVIKNLPGSSFVRKCLADVKVAHGGGPFMELGKNGKENGVALVEVEHRKDLELMLSRHKAAFGGHLAHVYKIPRTEFKSRVKDSRPMSPVDEGDGSKYTCVEIDGLSWGCDEEKVRKFFSGLRILPNGLHIFLDVSGKASGIGYLEFETSSDCSKAMEKHKQYLDNRYLILRMISQSEMNGLLERHYRSGGRFLNDTFGGRGRPAHPEGGAGGHEETVVYMKNLNARTRLEDILEFFHGYEIVKDSIQLQYKDDRPTGDGMVKFGSRREAEDALGQLNRKVMLGKVVELLF